jgi:hypothetical protein
MLYLMNNLFFHLDIIYNHLEIYKLIFSFYLIYLNDEHNEFHFHHMNIHFHNNESKFIYLEKKQIFFFIYYKTNLI